MLNILRNQSWRLAAGTLACLAATGCAFGQRNVDIDNTPIANAGAGATIIYPGRNAPNFSTGGHGGPPGGVLSPGNQPGQGQAGGHGSPAEAPVGQTQPTTQSYQRGNGGGSYNRSGSPAGDGGNVSFIGGSEMNEVMHKQYQEQPTWFKYVALPLEIAALPVVAAVDAVKGDPDPGPAVPNVTTQTKLPEPVPVQAPNQEATPQAQGQAQSPQQYAYNTAPGQAPRAQHSPALPPSPQSYGRAPAPPPSVPRDYESQQLSALERELAGRAPRGGNPRGDVSPGPSIADELATLQRYAYAPQDGTPTATAPPLAQRGGRVATQAPSRAPMPPADGIVDRNQDGRVDHWIYRDQGRMSKEVLDDDFDGRVDRTVMYDPSSQQVVRIEEDVDQDSRTDAWTDYDTGRVTRRRADVDRDGVVDSWTYYQAGEVSRHERDTTGDGFRDSVGYYREGQLHSEKQDLDGDGHMEITLHYDEREQLRRREEDVDRDGDSDVVSHYEDGRLTSRELLDPDAFERARAGNR